MGPSFTSLCEAKSPKKRKKKRSRIQTREVESSRSRPFMELEFELILWVEKGGDTQRTLVGMEAKAEGAMFTRPGYERWYSIPLVPFQVRKSPPRISTPRLRAVALGSAYSVYRRPYFLFFFFFIFFGLLLFSTSLIFIYIKSLLSTGREIYISIK